MVVIAEGPVLSTGVMQERVATPSTCTVQAPHSAAAQPNFVPVMPSTSRNTHRRGVSPSTSTVRSTRLTLIVVAIVIPPGFSNAILRSTRRDGTPFRARRLGRRPFGAPAAAGTIHLVARVLRELHGKAVAAQPPRLDTGVDQRLGQFSPLFVRAATPDRA